MRIQGITIPDNKRLEFALSVIFGIGRQKSKSILKDLGIDHMKKTKELSSEEENKIRESIEKIKIEGNLKREISGNIKRMKDIHAYRGIRHSKRLPARGQRSKTNSRTVRGNVRKTMSSGRKTVDKK